MPKGQERIAVVAVKNTMFGINKPKISPILTERKPFCISEKFKLQNIFREIALYYIY